jgi:hypothetical protein
MQNTIDVIEWDKLPFHSYLNRTFIQLLEQRGVPQDYFLSLARKEVDELVKVSKSYDLLLDRYQARASSPENASMFDDDLLLGMLHARVPLDEPVMLSEVNKFISDELAVFKEKVSRWKICFENCPQALNGMNRTELFFADPSRVNSL